LDPKMTAVSERGCALLLPRVEADPNTAGTEQLKRMFEGSNDERVQALEDILCRGPTERPERYLMSVIKYAMPQNDPKITRLVMLYGEMINPITDDGRLLPEMILFCDHIRRWLQSPNEFQRAVALRFIVHFPYREIMEPLIPATRQNLEHRHSIVRANAVVAVHKIYSRFSDLIPDAVDIIYECLDKETCPIVMRNGLESLMEHDVQTALAFVAGKFKNQEMPPPVWMVALVLLAKCLLKHAEEYSSKRSLLIKEIIRGLDCEDDAVVFEAAILLAKVTYNPTSIKLAITSLITLLNKTSQLSAKLIILEHLVAIGQRHGGGIIGEMLADFLQCLAVPNPEVQRKVFELVRGKDVLGNENIGTYIEALKKGMEVCHDKPDVVALYVENMATAVNRFPDVYPKVLDFFLNSLATVNESTSEVIIALIRDTAQRYPELRREIVDQLLEILPEITFEKVFRGLLFVLAEFSDNTAGSDQTQRALQAIIGLIGNLPLAPPKTGEEAKSNPDPAPTALRKMLLSNEQEYIKVQTATTLSRLLYKLQANPPANPVHLHMLHATVLLVLTGIARKLDGYSRKALDNQLSLFLNGATAPSQRDLFERVCNLGSKCLDAIARRTQVEDTEEEVMIRREAGGAINFTSLRPAGVETSEMDIDDDDSVDMMGPRGGEREKGVYPLSGFGDAIYAEAKVSFSGHDIVLDYTIINRTEKTLQNVDLEISTRGDINLVEKPPTFTLAPWAEAKMRASVKVESTESSFIYGNIVYERAGNELGQVVIVLHEINVDILDYISPRDCPEDEWNDMWKKFEWENKIVVDTNMLDLDEFLTHITTSTHMKAISNVNVDTTQNSGAFLAANLYARSTFGEDALANVSLGKTGPDAPITGHIRIRSKTQGIALSLGDTFNLVMKKK